MNPKVFFALAGIFLAAFFCLASPAQAQDEMPLARVLVGPGELIVEMADTPARRWQGLGGRKSLDPDRGMAFLPERPRNMQMTMRGMLFPLDFIWCRDGMVIRVDHKVSHEKGASELILSPAEVDLVLEAPAGWSRSHGVKAGHVVTVFPYGGG